MRLRRHSCLSEVCAFPPSRQEKGSRLGLIVIQFRLLNMGGDERVQDEMFSGVTLEQRVPRAHPLREIRELADSVLHSLSGEVDTLYSTSGRPLIAPEYMLRALFLRGFHSVRSERLLVEEIDYNLLLRWFVGLGMDDAVWNHAVFSKNRDRLLNSTVAQSFFAAVNEQAKKFMSDDHFTVDGTLIQAWASQKSFPAKDGSDEDDGADFHGHKRSNDTHQSTTDPDERLYKKSFGKESKLSCLGHALVEKTFGWLKQTGPPRPVKLRGLAKVDWLFVVNCAAHNLMRLPRLIAQRTEQGLRQQCA